MQLYRILKLMSLSAGLLFLGASASACAVSTEEEACDDEAACLPGEESDESVDSSEQEFSRYRRRDLAGYRFRSRFEPFVYLIDYDGYRRRLPDYYRYGDLFRDRNIYYDDLIDYIPRRSAFSRDVFLGRSWDNDDDLWLIDRGRRHRLRDRYVMDRYHFGWHNVRSLHRNYYDRLPFGYDWY